MLKENLHQYKLKIIIEHCIILGLLYCYIILSNGFCPIKAIFHIPCAGCGLTRAVTSFFCGELIQAFNYHPLFWLAPIMIFFAVHFPKFFDNYNKKFYVSMLIFMGGLFLICYLVRISIYGINFI